jgi:hypothetical protein
MCAEGRSGKNVKYKYVLTEMQHMWNVKEIPIITGANGSLSQTFQKHLEDIPGKHSSVQLQKTVTLQTA